MKTRNGFVSNSSSSSYIIVLNKVTNKCPHCGRTDANLLDAIRTQGTVDVCYDTCIHAIGRDEVLRLILENPLINYLRVRGLEIKSNEEIAYISISNHDNAIRNIFENLIASGNVRII